MRKLWFLFLFLFGASAYGQLNPVNGYCNLGASQAAVSGLSSTNYQQGIIPGCKVEVFLTGTQTHATIYSNASGTPLGNPFTAINLPSANAGSWVFWASGAQALDIVLSGGTCPACYSQPVTISDVFPSGGSSGSGSVIGITPGMGIICSPLLNGQCVGNVTVGATPIATGTIVQIVGDSRNLVATGNTTTATAIACSAGTCIVTDSQSYTAGQYVQMENNIIPGAPVGTSFQIVQVLSTGLSGSQFEFSCNTTVTTGCTGSNSGGTVQDATYFASSLLAKSPLLSGATVYNTGGSGQTVASMVSVYTAQVHPNTFAVTGKPCDIIVMSGAEDLINGTSLATIESGLQSYWALVHADGCQVFAVTQAGIFLIGVTANWTPLNAFIRASAKSSTNISSGQYYDHLVDLGRLLYNFNDTNYFQSGIHFTDQGNQVYGDAMIEAISAQAARKADTQCSSIIDCPALDQSNSFTNLQNFISSFSSNEPFQVEASAGSNTQFSLGTFGSIVYSRTQSLLSTSYWAVGGGPSGVQEHLPGYQVFCWNNVFSTVGSSPVTVACDTGISRDTSVTGQMDIGNGTQGDVSGSARMSSCTGCTTAMGTQALSSGTATVTNSTACTAGSTCVYSLTNCGTSGTVGVLSVGTVVAGTSFVINSSSGTDGSTVCWAIFKK